MAYGDPRNPAVSQGQPSTTIEELIAQITGGKSQERPQIGLMPEGPTIPQAAPESVFDKYIKQRAQGYDSIVNGGPVNPGGNGNIMELLSGISAPGGSIPEKYDINNRPQVGLLPGPEQQGNALDLGLGSILSTPPVEQDPAEVAMQELLSLIQGGPSVDDHSLQSAISEAVSGARAPFEAQIGTINNQNDRARKDTDEGTDKINAMYRSLSKTYKDAGAEEAAQSQQLADSLQATGEKSADVIRQDTRSTLDANAAAGNVLGSDELTAQLNSQVNASTGENVNRVLGQGQRDASHVLRTGGINRTHMNEGGQNANLEGTNRASDLVTDLQNYLQANRDRIGELKGQAEGAASQARVGAESSLTSAASENHNRLIDQLMGYLGLNNTLQNSAVSREAELNKQQQGAGGLGLEGLLKYLPESVGNNMALMSQLPPDSQSRLKGLYDEFADNNSMLSGVMDSPQGEVSLNNYGNMDKYIRRVFSEGDSGAGDMDTYNGLQPFEREILRAMLLNQVAGSKTPKR